MEVAVGSSLVSAAPWPEIRHRAIGSNPRPRPKIRPRERNVSVCLSDENGEQGLMSAPSQFRDGGKRNKYRMNVTRTFIFLKRVIIRTASVESGTGEPMPMSWPVSLGSNFSCCG